MKQQTVILLGVSAVALLVLTGAGGQSDSDVLNEASSGFYDFTKVDDEVDDLVRINNLYAVLMQQGLTPMQNQLLLSQMFYETGILTDQANYNAIDNLNNWAGIGGDNSLRAYPDLQSFFNDYLKILRRGANPLGATNNVDFVNRLKTNAYFEMSKPVYQAGYNKVYHQLYLASQ